MIYQRGYNSYIYIYISTLSISMLYYFRGVTGEDLCQVDMNGIANEKENVEVKRQVGGAEGTIIADVITVPEHSKCVGKPGTDIYYCLCKPPFSEDVTLEYPNCLHQAGSCDSKLCVHGACVTAPSNKGQAICMCYTGYTGSECDRMVRMSNLRISNSNIELTGPSY